MMTTMLRTVLVYLLLLIVIRVMGKRQIGELQTSEFIVTILLSEIASAPVTNERIPFSHAVFPIGVLLVLEVTISALLVRFNPLKRLFYGSPSVIIRQGRIDMREMRRNRMEIDELLSELRQKGISDPADVYYAILEENGKLSVFPTAEKAPATPDDLSLSPEERGIAHACVLDGVISERNLRNAGWDRARLDGEIRRRGMKLEEVFVLTVDDCGNVTCIPKSEKDSG